MEKVTIGVEQVLQHLKNGMTRDDIAEHYGITKGECKILFQDERLKGKKTIKKPNFVLVQNETELTEDLTKELIEDIVENHEVSKDAVVGDTVKDSFGSTTTDEDGQEPAIEVEDKEEEEVVVPAAEAAKATWDD